MKMSRIAINRYIAKIIISQFILLVYALSVLLYVSILRESRFKEISIYEEPNNSDFTYRLKECNETFFETYPAEPKIEDCEKMQTCRSNLCFADVAEITNNLTICEKIFDPDIKVFCVAKVIVNSTKCLDVNDTGLREVCLESIEMKTAGI